MYNSRESQHRGPGPMPPSKKPESRPPRRRARRLESDAGFDAILAREGLPLLDSPEYRDPKFPSPRVAAVHALMVKAGLKQPLDGRPIPIRLGRPVDLEQWLRCEPSKKG